MQQPETTEPGADEVSGAQQPGETATPPSKARRWAFRIVAIVFALWVLARNFFGLLEVVLMWLPTETLTEIFSELSAAEIAGDRVHFMSIGVVSWVLVLVLFAQWRKPELRVAPFVVLVVMAGGATVLFGLSGTLRDWLIEEVALVAVPVALLAWLHPGRGRLAETPGLDRPMAALAAVASIPWIAFVLDNAVAQWEGAAGDHATGEHWAIAALAAVAVLATAWLGSTGYPGWRLPAWIAVGTSLILGLDSMVFPDAASSLPAFWAVGAIGWAIAFAVALVRRSRARRSGS